MVEVRPATVDDLPAVLDVETRAFGANKAGPEIADLVGRLLEDRTAAPRWSLLAFDGDQPVGHILFTHARLEPAVDGLQVSLLGPLAVAPEAQRRGVGTALVREGLRLLREAGIDLVFVLGIPIYYPRHGFRPATPFGFRAPYHSPELQGDAWMVQELRTGLLGAVIGDVRCAATIDEKRFWRE